MPSTRTTRTKRIPSNHKRTNNKPKLLPVINSYCLSGWTKVPLQPESQQQLRCILIAAMAGFKTAGQHWEAATPMIAMFSVLGFPSQNAKIHCGILKLCPQAKNHLIRNPTGSKAPTIIPWGPARLSNGIHPRFQCPDLSSWLWQNVPMKCFF